MAQANQCQSDPASAREELWGELRNRQSLVIQAWPSPALLSILRQHLTEIAGRGGHVAVVQDSETARQEGQPWALGGGFLEGVFHDPGQFSRGNGLACPVRFMIDTLSNPETADWFDRLRLLLVPVGEQIFRRPYAWEFLALSLADRARERQCPLPQIVVVIGPRRSPESAIRDILPSSPNGGDKVSAWGEISFPGSQPGRTWWNIWTTQSSGDYGAGLSLHTRDHYSGIEPVLAHFAGLWDISASRLIGHERVATVDQAQAIQKDAAKTLCQQDGRGPWGALPPSENFVGAVTLRDANGNPWRCLSAVAAAGNQDILVNIVSKHTALLPYFLANGRFFAYQPLEPLSPKKANACEAPFDTIIQLVGRIKIAGRLPLKTVTDTLVSAGLASGADADGGEVGAFKKLVGQHLDPAIADAINVTSTLQWQPDNAGFGRIAYVSLGEQVLRSANVEWLRFVDIRDESGMVYQQIRADHVLQTYLPGQLCVIEGKSFRVERVAWPERCVFVSHDDTLAEPDYRTTHRITFMTPAAERKPLNAHPGVTDRIRGISMETQYYRCEFKIDTLGYCESPDHWATPPVYRQLDGHPARHYRQGRVARLALSRLDGGSLLSPSASIALALWLNEAVVALFPEVYRYFIAVADVSDEDQPASFPVDMIVPRLQGERCHDNGILIFEDSHSDLGIARAIADNGPFILDLCSDYLAWFLEENTADSRMGKPVGLENKLLPSVDFFCFGTAAHDPAIGLAELRVALQDWEPQFGEQSFTKRRKRAMTKGGGLSLLADAALNGQPNCDFCGGLIENGEMQIMPEDGRIRCTACSAHGVDSLEKLQSLYPVARRFFTENLGLAFTENVAVNLTNQADLARRAGQTFIPTSGFDPRSVGLAVSRSSFGDSRGGQRHEVLIESGFSPEETAATLAHELTHIWQYNELDHEKMHRDYGNLLFEGHAVWVQAEFLKAQAKGSGFDPGRLGKATENVESLLHGDNEYGRGYNLLMGLSGGNVGSGIKPFEWLAKKYPR